MHFKDHAIEIIKDCNSGYLRCHECPLLECGDNTTRLADELRDQGLNSVKIGEYFRYDRQVCHDERQRRLAEVLKDKD
jgi:hypothetical protein